MPRKPTLYPKFVAVRTLVSVAMRDKALKSDYRYVHIALLSLELEEDEINRIEAYLGYRSHSTLELYEFVTTVNRRK